MEEEQTKCQRSSRAWREYLRRTFRPSVTRDDGNKIRSRGVWGAGSSCGRSESWAMTAKQNKDLCLEDPSRVRLVSVQLRCSGTHHRHIQYQCCCKWLHGLRCVLQRSYLHMKIASTRWISSSNSRVMSSACLAMVATRSGACSGSLVANLALVHHRMTRSRL